MSGRRSEARWRAALLVTLALVLQAAFTSFAMGRTGESPARDAFGHILCITAADAAAPTGGSPHHHALPDCCTVACSMFWPQLPAPNGQLALRLPAIFGDIPPPIRVAGVASSFLDHRHSHPRAPPMTA